MARKKTRSHRSASWKIPILPTAGMIAGLTTSLNDRYSIVDSIMAHIQSGNYKEIGAALLTQTIGVDPITKSLKIPTFTVCVAASVIAEKMLNKLARGAFKGLPIRW